MQNFTSLVKTSRLKMFFQSFWNRISKKIKYTIKINTSTASRVCQRKNWKQIQNSNRRLLRWFPTEGESLKRQYLFRLHKYYDHKENRKVDIMIKWQKNRKSNRGDEIGFSNGEDYKNTESINKHRRLLKV